MKLIRKDFQVIENCIEQGAKVLDLGCGDGSLLDYLKHQKKIMARGIEINLSKVDKCLKKKISVYHGEIVEGLSLYSSDFFDVIILSRTIQEIANLKQVLNEIFRVGKKVILGFINYGYYRNRMHFFLKGTKPTNEAFPHYWYDTPNIRFLSIREFESYCKAENLKIIKRFFLKGDWFKKAVFFHNLFAGYAIYFLKKKPS